MLCEGYNPSNGTYHNVTCLEHCRGDQHVVCEGYHTCPNSNQHGTYHNVTCLEHCRGDQHVV